MKIWAAIIGALIFSAVLAWGFVTNAEESIDESPTYLFVELFSFGVASLDSETFSLDSPRDSIRLTYANNEGLGLAEVHIPHIRGRSSVVLVKRGNGPPDFDCVEPGLERYYDLSADIEYVCNSRFGWYSGGDKFPKVFKPWLWGK